MTRSAFNTPAKKLCQCLACAGANMFGITIRLRLLNWAGVREYLPTPLYIPRDSRAVAAPMERPHNAMVDTCRLHIHNP